MNALGQPEIVSPQAPQFEISRKYLEWVARNVTGGVTYIKVDEGRYVLFERDL